MFSSLHSLKRPLFKLVFKVVHSVLLYMSAWHMHRFLVTSMLFCMTAGALPGLENVTVKAAIRSFAHVTASACVSSRCHTRSTHRHTSGTRTRTKNKTIGGRSVRTDAVRLGSFSKGDALPKREELPHTADGYDTQGVLLVQRCLIVRRDEKGYGLTVSGDNPVFVQSVKPGGAAARAGVHQGDRIIKVNGTLVTQSNHQDVVHLIKSGAHVALTLLGPPPSGAGERPNGGSGGVSAVPAASPPGHQPLVSKQSSERITGPQPVDPEKQQQCTNISYLTIKKMLEKEQAYLMQLLQEYGKTSSEKCQAEMQSARKRIAHLESQLLALRGSNPGSEGAAAVSGVPRSRGSIEARRSTEGPEGLRSSSFHVAPHSSGSGGRPRSGPLSSSASLENLSHALGPSPWSVPTHLRQRSSPETLLCTLEGPLGPVEEPLVGPSLDLGLVPSSSCTDDPPVTPVRDPSEILEGWRGDDMAEDADNTSEEGFLEGELPGLDDSLEGRPLQYGTPPEAPPSGGRVPLQQSSILSMDDEERTSDSELTQLGDNGPFNNIWKLLRHPAHLAVFLHYLLSNQSDPSSLLFLIITNLYKLGTGKEMKKWAYEITSTFLVQSAPLSIENIDETILKEIDKVLQSSQEQGQEEEELKDVFLKAREKAMEQLKRLLVDFRNTRTIGLSGLYMPNDVTLDDSLRDKNAELRIVESLLLTELETLAKEDPENLSDYKSALASALATVLKSFGVKTPNAVTLMERFPTFVAREKSRLKFFPRNKKFAFQTIHTRGHHFQSQQYHCVTYCNHCQHIIWGVGDQGYQCSNCEMNIHKTCVRVVEEQCIGSLMRQPKKPKKNHRMSGVGIIEGIKTKARRPNTRRGTQHSVEDWSGSLDHALPLDSSERGRPDTGDECEVSTMGGAAEMLDRGAARKSSATAVGRSESFRQRRETRPSYRKRSDPNIPRSKSDVDVDDKPTNLNNSGSSSNSSLSTSRSLESPSQSWEAVHRSGEVPALGPLDDSDLEWDLEPPDWQAALGRETLRQLKPKEKKRQDVLNELFYTERSHVRTLKVLERIFRRPLQQQELLAPELLQRLFPNLDELLRIHQGFSNLMKRRRAQEPLIGDIGPMMLTMLDGESGERLQQAVATFCQHQSLALEALKARQKKDQKLAQFLADAEMHPLCRRLQLKDLVAAGFQRLTKYPLLIENVAKHSALGSAEHAQLQRALQCSKRILAHVNQAVREAENAHRLGELQRRLDKSSLDKVENHPLSMVYRQLDLRRHRLVHEGALTMRLPRQKPLDVQLVLLEDLLLVLQRQDERLALRFHSVSLPTATAEDRMLQCPVMRLRHLHARDVATDPRAFFLLDTMPEQRAMWEFAAASAAEKRSWLEHIGAATRAHAPPDDEGKHVPDTPPADEAPAATTIDGAADHEDEEEEVPTDKEEGGSSREDETPPASAAAVQPDKGEASEKEEGEKEEGVLVGAPVATPSVAQGGLSLVDFQEVVVVPSAPCETATPVLTPIERLRRQDQQVLSALADKQALLAEILRIPSEDYVHLAEISEEMNSEKGLMELLLQVTYHANQLPVLINEALNVTEEDAVAAASSPEGGARRPGVCPHRLLLSVQPLLRYLSLLAPSLAELEQERQRLRQELSRLQDARQPPPCSEEDDGGALPVVADDELAPSSEICREAAVQTLEEAVCHCPTTDLDAEEELPQPPQAPVYF